MIYYSKGTVQEYEQMPETLEFDETATYQYDGIIETKMVTSTKEDSNQAYQIKFYHNGMELEGVIPVPTNQPINTLMYGTIYFTNMKFHPIAKASIEIISSELRYPYEGGTNKR